ncbi:MAG TPA: YceI family protein [Gaiellaceae bacterium]|jgi:polyisoprenoid-binding protein YceI|nr:YceI family protein [Gaiellaceae bacterium]
MQILAETAASVIPAGTWSIDPAHSTLEFSITHMGLATVKGRALGISGTIVGGPEPSLSGTVPVAGITTFDENRDAHLRSPEFFDAERYPELTFRSTQIVAEGDRLRIEGELTMKGVTRPVRLEGHLTGTGTDPWGNERIGLELSATIDRTEFGLTWNAPLPGGGFLLPNTVQLAASFSAIKTA